MKKLLATTASILFAFSLNASELVSSFEEKSSTFIEWIETKTDYVYDGQALPRFLLVEPEQLYLDLYGADWQNVIDPERGSDAYAYYDHFTNLIVARNDIDIVNDLEKSYVLVHELVHFMQHINDNLDPCPGNNEKEAHDLHHLWTVENNLTERKTDPLFLFMLSLSCKPNMIP